MKNDPVPAGRMAFGLPHPRSNRTLLDAPSHSTPIAGISIFNYRPTGNIHPTASELQSPGRVLPVERLTELMV